MAGAKSSEAEPVDETSRLLVPASNNPDGPIAASIVVSTSAEQRASSRRKRRWEERARAALPVWSPFSPHFRFYLLALAVLIPFGPHFVKYLLTPIVR